MELSGLEPSLQLRVGFKSNWVPSRPETPLWRGGMICVRMRDKSHSTTKIPIYSRQITAGFGPMTWTYSLLPDGFTVGARWTAGKALHGTDDPASRTTHRVGPIAYTLFNKPGASFNTPTLFLISQWNAQHPYRTGEVSSVWMPTVSLDSDLPSLVLE